MTKKVLQTLQVGFAVPEADTDGRIILEIDSRDDGMNGGDTSFEPGDTPYFLMYLDNVTLDRVGITTGVVTFIEEVVIEHEEFLVFNNAKSEQTQYPITAYSSLEQVGNFLEKVTSPDGTINYVPYTGGLVQTGRSTIEATTDVLGVAKIKYQATARIYRISNVPRAVTAVLVYAIGDTID